MTGGGQLPDRIWLVGLSGSGKSTVARIMSGHLGWPAFDSDQLIRDESGLDIPEIFDRHGEACFRRWERVMLERAAGSSEPIVIATGGGQMQISGAVDSMLQSGLVVYLQVSPAVCAERLAPSLKSEGRPMLASRDATLTESIAELLQIRSATYARAHLTIDVEAISAAAAGAQILEMLSVDRG